MAICEDLANVSDLAIYRPDRSGPGGDIQSVTTVASGLKAIHEPRNRLIKVSGPPAREVVITGLFFIDAFDADGNVYAVQPEDLLQYTDFRGVLVDRQEIQIVTPAYCGADLEHLELEIGRS